MDSILGTRSLSPDLLDLNGDGQIDVSDVVAYLGGSRPSIAGYTWLVGATFGTGEEEALLSRSYNFALQVEDGVATVVAIDELDPTKGLLAQDFGASEFLPSRVIPQDTVFSVLEDPGACETAGEGCFVLVSQEVSQDPGGTNPLSTTLTRSWSMTVSLPVVYSDELAHGTITANMQAMVGIENQGGEDVPLIYSTANTGTIRWSRIAPNVAQVDE
ncbi:MAG: hypothetical protein AAGA68_21165 [Pseudomonadota bacterium]